MSDVKKVEKARDSLLATARTMTIATLHDEDKSQIETGFSPFARLEDGSFIIYTSRLSAHVRALLAGKPAQFTIIQDEVEAANIWARHRLKFTASWQEIPRDDERFSAYCALIGARSGPTMDLIQQFSDFHLLQITPQEGVLVTGFAAAYKVQGPFFTISEHLSKT